VGRPRAVRESTEARAWVDRSPCVGRPKPVRGSTEARAWVDRSPCVGRPRPGQASGEARPGVGGGPARGRRRPGQGSEEARPGVGGGPARGLGKPGQASEEARPGVDRPMRTRVPTFGQAVRGSGGGIQSNGGLRAWRGAWMASAKKIRTKLLLPTLLHSRNERSMTIVCTRSAGSLVVLAALLAGPEQPGRVSLRPPLYDRGAIEATTTR
jgi:hypothetical protein